MLTEKFEAYPTLDTSEVLTQPLWDTIKILTLEPQQMLLPGHRCNR